MRGAESHNKEHGSQGVNISELGKAWSGWRKASWGGDFEEGKEEPATKTVRDGHLSMCSASGICLPALLSIL